jgi:hypothetical protein
VVVFAVTVGVEEAAGMTAGITLADAPEAVLVPSALIAEIRNV